MPPVPSPHLSETTAHCVARLVRKILSSSSRPEIRSLLPELTRTLDRTSRAHDERRSAASALPSRESGMGRTERFPWVEEEYGRILRSASIDYSRRRNRCRALVDDAPPPPPLSTDNATYGETPPSTVSNLLHFLSPPRPHSTHTFPGRFVDAGSGHGGVVLCAALEGLFPHCLGIEYDPDRSHHASFLERQYNEEERKGASSSTVELVRGDLSDYEKRWFDDASLVFSNCVVFDSKLSLAMGKALDEGKVKDGAFVVTISRRFSLPSFDLVDVVRLPCNGGDDFTFYVNQKRRKESAAEAEAGLPAVLDSETTRRLREDLGEDGLGEVALREGGGEGLSLLTALGASEPNVRPMGENTDLLGALGDRLSASDHGLKTRAGASMVLRAVAAFPTGCRSVAKHPALPSRILDSLDAGRRGTVDEHPIVRANPVDVLGQVLHDHVGNEALGNLGVDGLIDGVSDGVGGEGVGVDVLREACEEVKAVRRWRAGIVR